MKNSSEELRTKYLMLQAYISGGKGIGHGSRIIYLKECDGVTARVFTSDGRAHALKVANISVGSVLDSTGAQVDWKILGNVLSVNGTNICAWGTEKKVKVLEKVLRDDDILDDILE